MLIYRIFPLILTCLCCEAALDVHADPRELLQALDYHQQIISLMLDPASDLNLSRYLQSIVLEDIKRFNDAFGSIANRDIIRHPINIFLLYRFWSESKDVWNKMGDETCFPELKAFISILPSEEATSGVALSILRLQSVFGLDARDMASGLIREHRSVRGLTSTECFYVARMAFSSMMKQEYEAWFQTCIEMVDFDVEVQERRKDHEKSLERMEKVMELLKSSGDTEEIQRMLHRSLPIDLIQRLMTEENEDTTKLFQVYRKLCQLEPPYATLLPPLERCEFLETVDGLGKLAPFKVEFHALDPLVIVVHEALGEKTLDEVNEAINAKDLEVPKSVSGSNGEVRTTAGRAGKVGFLEKLPKSLYSLANRITGLSMEHSEALQIVSYGIGGHFEPHVDYFRTSQAAEDRFASMVGDRIATLLLYLNEVEEGGATVFPRLGLAVHPEKGSALFWFNLFRNGMGDPFTLHSGCPVLIGSKMIANNWFREQGQEFLRPCDINQDM